jgi:ATP-dependent Clp protease protease subunit
MPLTDQRVVQLWGRLDAGAVSRACAELMVLDATGDEAVGLYLGSCYGPVDEAWALVDTIDLMGVPVNVTCLGRAEGAALAVVAAGARRTAAPHAQFHLCLPDASAHGSARQLEAWAEQQGSLTAQFASRLASATGRPLEHVEADLSIGRWLDAPEARAYGLVDDIWPQR